MFIEVFVSYEENLRGAQTPLFIIMFREVYISYEEILICKVSTTIGSVCISKLVRVMVFRLLVLISINALYFGMLFHSLSSSDMQGLKEKIQCQRHMLTNVMKDRLIVYINNLIMLVGFLVILYGMLLENFTCFCVCVFNVS